MVFNATFNNISVISWPSVLLVQETGVPGENHRPAASHWQTLSHNVVSSTPRHECGRTHNLSGDRHELHRYNYQTITTTTIPCIEVVFRISNKCKTKSYFRMKYWLFYSLLCCLLGIVTTSFLKCLVITLLCLRVNWINNWTDKYPISYIIEIIF